MSRCTNNCSCPARTLQFIFPYIFPRISLWTSSGPDGSVFVQPSTFLVVYPFGVRQLHTNWFKSSNTTTNCCLLGKISNVQSEVHTTAQLSVMSKVKFTLRHSYQSCPKWSSHYGTAVVMSKVKFTLRHSCQSCPKWSSHDGTAIRHFQREVHTTAQLSDISKVKFTLRHSYQTSFFCRIHPVLTHHIKYW